jgi:hypothetical protein
MKHAAGTMPISARHRVAAALAAVVLLIGMLLISRDFGFTWDERFQQKYGEQIWDYYHGRLPRETFNPRPGNQYLYGGLVELLCVAAQQLVRGDLYVIRHVVIAIFGWIGIVFSGLLAARAFGARAGWLAAALLAVSPRYFGDAMNNPKDAPFAALVVVVLYYILNVDKRSGHLPRTLAAKLTAAIALAINVRPLGLVLLLYAGGVIGTLALVAALRSTEPDRWRSLAITAGRLAVMAIVAIPAGTIAWPWAQASPYLRPIEAFLITSRLNWATGFEVLFAGQSVSAGSLPWTYVPTWLAFALPPAVLAGVALSVLVWRRGIDAAVAWAALALFAGTPVLMAIVRNATIYDGIRHLLFIVPPATILAAAGWAAALDARPPARAIVAILLTFGIAEPLFFQIRNHPNQIVYFSPLSGGPRAAFGRYDMDYWANSVLQAVQWSAEVAKRSHMPIGVSGNPAQAVEADAARYRSVWFAPLSSPDFHLDIRLLRGPRDAVREVAARADVLHRVTTADGTPLCVVLPGPAFHRDRDRIQLNP